MTVSYSWENYSPYPVSIQYTGWKDTSGQTIQPTNLVTFSYDSYVRPDRPISYASYGFYQLT